MYNSITIKRLEKPNEKNLNRDIRWVCKSLGFCRGRDTERTSPKIISVLLKRVAKNERVRSDEIARELLIKGSRVNHHIRNLVDSGLLYREKHKIRLRGGSMKAAILEMKRDTDRVFEDLLSIAEEIDREVGLRSR